MCYSRKRYSFKLHVFDDDIDSQWTTNFTFRRKRMHYAICIVSGKDTMRLVHNQCAFTHIPNICSMTVTPRGLGVVVITHCGWDGANLSILINLSSSRFPTFPPFFTSMVHDMSPWQPLLCASSSNDHGVTYPDISGSIHNKGQFIDIYNTAVKM